MKFSIRSVILSSALVLAPTWASYADEGDSSADIPSGYAQQVKDSQGVVIKVPMDVNGNVLTDAAELRVVTISSQPTSGAEAKALWDSFSVETPKVAAGSSTSDSSTYGRWGYPGWNWGYRYGWQPYTYYYNTYYPVWNYGGYYYNFYRPYYYNTYNPYYGGYGYYYYPRGW